MKTIIETTPKFNLIVKDIEDLPTELVQYAVIYQDLFGRREQKEHYRTYLEGLMLDVPNKSVETIMLNLKGDDPNAIRNMQHFVSKGSWQNKAILQRHWQEVSHDLGDENGVLIVVSNGRRYAGGELLLSPQAKLDDGLFEVWLFRGEHIARVFRYLPEMMLGQHLEDEGLTVVNGRHITIHTDSPIPAQTDGDRARHSPLAVSIQPGALRLLVPDTAPADLFSRPGKSLDE